MKLFKCDNCTHPIYFDNTVCVKCENFLGFDARHMKMVSLKKIGTESYKETISEETFKFCANHQHDVCNWVIPYAHSAEFCTACSLNRTIPILTKPEYLERWKVIELAKHRLIYALLRWGFPIVNKQDDPVNGLAFDFKSDAEMPSGEKVLTGHASGLITMNIAEADDVEREMARNNMDEVYRTVLGHFRHEVGHYYWDQLIANSKFLEPFRQIYGDETYSYQDALTNYYNNGAPKDWHLNYISAYATMHPWESWAETWAHYMHIVDTLETAYSYGLSINPKIELENGTNRIDIVKNAYDCKDFDNIFDKWLPVSFMMNSLNRSMGSRDIYPFVINPAVKQKLRFIHEVIHSQDN